MPNETIEIKKIPAGVKHCLMCSAEVIKYPRCKPCQIIHDRQTLSLYKMDKKYGPNWEKEANEKVMERRQLAGKKNNIGMSCRERQLETRLRTCAEKYELREPEESNWIYFAHALGTNPPLVKVGVTTNEDTNERIKGLQTGCPYKLTELYKARETTLGFTEKQLHRKFASVHVNGEWFKLEGALEEYLKEKILL
jgi:hypothetical protein